MGGEDYAPRWTLPALARKLSMVWNMYDLLPPCTPKSTKWEWDGSFEDPSSDLNNPRSMCGRVARAPADTKLPKNSGYYDIPNAVKPILPFADVRPAGTSAAVAAVLEASAKNAAGASRDDGDKNDSTARCATCCRRPGHIMAPFTPFLAEELF